MTPNSNLSQLQIPRLEVEKRLQERINLGKALLKLSVRNENELKSAGEKKRKWSEYNDELLRRMVGNDEFVNEFHPTAFAIPWGPIPLESRIKGFFEGTQRDILKLESILERLELIPESPILNLDGFSSQQNEPSRPNLQQRIKLFQILCDHFDESELKTLCFHLAVDYDALPDVGKNNKAREMIVLVERKERIQELIEEGKRLRPNSKWDM